MKYKIALPIFKEFLLFVKIPIKYKRKLNFGKNLSISIIYNFYKK